MSALERPVLLVGGGMNIFQSAMTRATYGAFAHARTLVVAARSICCGRITGAIVILPINVQSAGDSDE